MQITCENCGVTARPDLDYCRWTHLPEDAPHSAGVTVSCGVCGVSHGTYSVTGEPTCLRAFFDAPAIAHPYREPG